MRKATRAVTQLFDEVLAPTGLRSTQLVLLLAVGAHEPAPIAELASIIVMDRSTLTRNLQPLVRAGMVKVVQGEDRRVRLVSLTAKGHRAILAAAPCWEQVQTQLTEQFGKRLWGRLVSQLNRVTKLAAAMRGGQDA